MRRACLLALLLAGCAEPTALLVFVDSDLALDRVTIEITGTDGVVTAPVSSEDFANAERPLLLTLLPDASHRVDDDIEIEVKGFSGFEEVIDSTLITSFTDGETRFVQMYLWRVCAELECLDGEICVADRESPMGDCETERRQAVRWDEDPAPIAEGP